MTCQDVGSTNSDIAGLGIVIAFAFQAGISLALSYLSMWLSKRPYWSLITTHILFLDSDLERLQKVVSNELPQGKARRFLETFISKLRRQYMENQDKDAINPSSSAKGPRRACLKRAINKVLATISDVQIMNAFAILLATLVQRQSTSLYHLRIVYEIASFTNISVCASLINVIYSEGKSNRSRAILLALFVVAYISFSVIFIIQINKWDEDLPGRCYNTQFVALPSTSHPLGDDVYFGITFLYSLAAILWCFLGGVTSPSLARFLSRYSTPGLLPTATCATSTSSLTSVPSTFGDKLLASIRSQAKSSVEFLRVIGAKNFNYNDLSLGPRFMAICLNELLPRKPEDRAWMIVNVAMVQYPLHLYMTIALRAGNESLLSGDSENTWGFGQIVALILCAATLLECIRGVSDYRKFVQLQRLEADENKGRRRNSC